MLKNNRIGNARIDFDGCSIELSATIANMDSFGAEMGTDPLTAMRSLDAEQHFGVAKLFHFMQVGTSYSAQEIYDWLFGDLARLSEDENAVKQIAEAPYTMMGVRIGKQIPDVDGAKKKDGI